MEMYVNKYALTSVNIFNESGETLPQEAFEAQYRAGSIFVVHGVSWNEIILKPVKKSDGEYKFSIGLDVLNFAFTVTDSI